MREQTLMKPVLVIALALLLAGCGTAGGSPATPTTSTASATTGTTATTATTATTGTTATTSTTAAAAPTTTTTSTTSTPSSTTATTATATTATTTASGTPPCRAAGLTLSFVGQQGGMGHGEIGFALRNTGSAPCRTYGYPGVLFLDQEGRPLLTIPHHTTRDFFGSGPAVPLVIAPGSSASFRLDVGHGVASSAGCDTAYGLQVIPPNDTATLRTKIPEGVYECRDANVSPLRAGGSAYP